MLNMEQTFLKDFSIVLSNISDFIVALGLISSSSLSFLSSAYKISQNFSSLPLPFSTIQSSEQG